MVRLTDCWIDGLNDHPFSPSILQSFNPQFHQSRRRPGQWHNERMTPPPGSRVSRVRTPSVRRPLAMARVCCLAHMHPSVVKEPGTHGSQTPIAPPGVRRAGGAILHSPWKLACTRTSGSPPRSRLRMAVLPTSIFATPPDAAWGPHATAHHSLAGEGRKCQGKPTGNDVEQQRLHHSRTHFLSLAPDLRSGGQENKKSRLRGLGGGACGSPALVDLPAALGAWPRTWTYGTRLPVKRRTV